MERGMPRGAVTHVDERKPSAGRPTTRGAGTTSQTKNHARAHLGKPLPQPDGPILEILILPEQRLVRSLRRAREALISARSFLPRGEYKAGAGGNSPASLCQSVFCPPAAAWRSMMV